MTAKKKPAFNDKIKALFEQKKKQAAVTSKQIAEALNVSEQTVSAMSGKLDNIKTSDFFMICETLAIPAGQTLYEVMALSDTDIIKNNLNS